MTFPYIDSTAGHEMMSFMDGFSGYNQIKMSIEDREKTAFTTPWGTFCYKVSNTQVKHSTILEQEHTPRLVTFQKPDLFEYRGKKGTKTKEIIQKLRMKTKNGILTQSW